MSVVAHSIWKLDYLRGKSLIMQAAGVASDSGDKHPAFLGGKRTVIRGNCYVLAQLRKRR